MHKDSLQRTLPGVALDQLRPVRVSGYRRIFNLLMRSLVDKNRAISGQQIAALNAVIGAGEEMGGVAFAIGAAEQEALNRREFCYRQIRGVQAYDFESGEMVAEVIFYSVYSPQELRESLPDFYRDEVELLGLEGLQHAEILPANAYLSLCLQGAYSWGDAFGEHFVDHTYLADGRTLLRGYLSREEIDQRLALDLSSYIQSR